MELKPSLLRADHAANGRAFEYSLPDVQDLLQDLESGVGIKTPILARSIDGEVWVVAGFRRLYAALVWEKTHPDFKIQIKLLGTLTDLEALILNIRENVARKSLSIIDIGADAQRLRDAGKSGQEIKEVLGLRSEASISQAIKLVRELPEYIQLLVHNGFITADDAFTVLKIEDPTKRSEVIATYLESRATQALEGEKASGDETITDAHISPDSETIPPPPPSNKKKAETIRDLASAAGANVGALRMPEFKKYLKDAIEMEGPGSHKGEVALKKSLLQLLDRDITFEEMDKKFTRIAKEKF